MRVTLVATHFAEYAARLALALAVRHTVQLHLARPNAGAELPGALRHALADTVALALHDAPARRDLVRQGAALVRATRDFGPDLVHAQEAAPWTLWAARGLGLARRVPFVLTVHDPRPHSGVDAVAWTRGRFPTSRLRRGADAVIVHGAGLVGDLDGVGRGRIAAMPHGVLGEACHRATQPVPGRLLFLGRIEAYKGLGILLDAAERLAREGLAFEIVVAGRGTDLHRHRARIAALAPRVVLEEGHVPPDALPDRLGRACVVVTPYLDATSSGVAALALNAGRPVVASRVGALPEMVRDGVNGLLVPPNDPVALAAVLRRLILDPALAARLGRGAAATADGPLSWAAVARRTEAVYAAALAGRPQAEESPSAVSSAGSIVPASETSVMPPSPR